MISLWDFSLEKQGKRRWCSLYFRLWQAVRWIILFAYLESTNRSKRIFASLRCCAFFSSCGVVIFLLWQHPSNATVVTGAERDVAWIIPDRGPLTTAFLSIFKMSQLSWKLERDFFTAKNTNYKIFTINKGPRSSKKQPRTEWILNGGRSVEKFFLTGLQPASGFHKQVIM